MAQLSPVLDISSSGVGERRLAGASAAVRGLAVWILVLVGALAMGVYANSLTNEFAYDDVTIIKDNPHVVNLEWTTIWTDNYWPAVNGSMPDVLYRPVTLWSYLANQWLTPGVSWPFHLVNIVLHALVSVLVCVLAWRLIGNRWVALLAGTLFAVHSIHTEAVANTVGRAELLAAMWSLLALLVFLPPTPLAADAGPVRRPWWHGLIVAACFLAAILSKETPVSLVLAIPLLDAWRWWRWRKDGRPAWFGWWASQAVRYYVPLAAALGLYLKLRIQACGLMGDSGHIHPEVNPLVVATLWERVVTPFGLLAKYLSLTFWPTHLSADYSAPSLVPTANPFFASAFQPPAAAGMLLLGLSLLTALRWRHKLPAFALLLGLFGTSYLLVANVVRIGTIFGERLFYWPSVFVVILAAWAVVSGCRRLSLAGAGMRRHAAVGSLVLVLAAPVAQMARLTWRRNADWADNITLAISTARDNPESAKACSWAGAVLTVADRPDYVLFGKTLIERAIELAPNFGDARWALAKYYGVRHDLGNSAIWIAQGARLDPGSHIACAAAPALIEEMQTARPESYMPVVEAYAAEHPQDPAAHLALAFGWHAQKEFDRAADCARKAITLADRARVNGYDQYHEAAAELARIWFDRGWVEQAADKYGLYVAYMNKSVDAHCTFATMLLAVDLKAHPGALDAAEATLALGARIDPQNSRVRELKGKILRLRRDLARGETTTPKADGNPEMANSASGGKPQ
jgi:hypothetical protein